MNVIPTISAPREDARDAYLSYLQSPEWRKRRDAALRKARFRCEQCQSKRKLQVHHLTYERLGDEAPDDLKVLCERCHEDQHVEHAEHNYLGLYLKIAGEILTDETRFESDVDLLEDFKCRCAKLKIPYRSDKLGRALEIVRQRLPYIRRDKRIVEAFVDRRNVQPITDFDARQLLRQLGGLGLVDRMKMPQVTPMSRRKSDAMLALKQVMRAIADQAHKCDELENQQ